MGASLSVLVNRIAPLASSGLIICGCPTGHPTSRSGSFATSGYAPTVRTKSWHADVDVGRSAQITSYPTAGNRIFGVGSAGSRQSPATVPDWPRRRGYRRQRTECCTHGRGLVAAAIFRSAPDLSHHEIPEGSAKPPAQSAQPLTSAVRPARRPIARLDRGIRLTS